MAPVESPQFAVGLPQRGIVRWSDALVLPTATLIYIAGASLLLPRSPRAALWSLGTVATLTFVLTVRLRIRPESMHWRQRLQRGHLGLIVSAVSLALAVMVLWGESGIGPRLLILPSLVPGLVLFTLAHRDSEDTLRRARSRLTDVALLYAILGFCAMLPNALVLLQAGWSRRLLLILPSTWTAASLLAVYYVVRRSEVTLHQARTIHDIETVLARSLDIPTALARTAALIHTRLQFDQVLLLTPVEDSAYASFAHSANRDELNAALGRFHLQVIAGAGPQTEVALGRTMPMDRGISGRSIRTGRPQRVGAVPDDSDYEPLGIQHARSELNVPVFDSLQPTRLVAVIAALSQEHNYFTGPDEKVVNRIGVALSRFWSDRMGEEFHRRLILGGQALTKVRSIEELLTDVPLLAGQLLDTRAVAAIHLGFGTAVPRAGAARDGDTVVSMSPALIGALAADPFVERSIVNWQPHILHGRKSRTEEGALDTFTSELWDIDGDRATIVIAPIGTPDNKTGLLIAVYQQMSRSFERQVSRRVADIALALSPYFTLIVERRLREELLSPTVRLHALLRSAGVRRDLTVPITDVDLAAINTFVSRVFDVWDSYGHPDFDAESLDVALERYVNLFRQRRGAGATWIGVAAIEDESRDLKLLVFRLVMEAVLNARAHSAATKVDVTLTRRGRHFLVTIDDDGEGFDLPASQHLDGDGGMAQLLRWVLRYCGDVRVAWHGTRQGGGCHLQVEFVVWPQGRAGD